MADKRTRLLTEEASVNELWWFPVDKDTAGEDVKVNTRNLRKKIAAQEHFADVAYRSGMLVAKNGLVWQASGDSIGAFSTSNFIPIAMIGFRHTIRSGERIIIPAYMRVTHYGDLTIDAGCTLWVVANAELVIINGSIINAGTLQNDGTITYASASGGQVKKITSADFTGSTITGQGLQALLTGKTADTQFLVFSDEGSGSLLKLTDGYTFDSGTGTITITPGNYRIQIL